MTAQPHQRPSTSGVGPKTGIDVAETVHDLTPGWVSAALSGPDGEVGVRAVATERVGTGQMGTAYRLTIAYDEGSQGPATLVAKLAAEDPAARMTVAPSYRKEVGFYAHIAATVAVRAPRCWAAGISEDGSAFSLLLEDLAPAAPGVQADGCSVEQATEAARNAAGLHAPRWNDSSLTDHDFLEVLDADGAAFLGSLHVDATEQFVDRYSSALSGDDVAVLRAAAAATGTWMAEAGPIVLTHGDYRLDNLMFHPDRPEVVAVDWQTLSLAPPGRDLAYLLGTSLDVADRRDHEDEVVAAYRAALVGHGVTDYDLATCHLDYRRGQLQGPFITVLGAIYATAERSDPADRMFLAMATRSCTAIRDLGSLDLVR